MRTRLGQGRPKGSGFTPAGRAARERPAGTPAGPPLLLSGIDVTYPGRPPVPALRDAGLRADGGRITALLGRNGAGKSTLLAVACGLRTPDAGLVHVLGEVHRHGSPRGSRRGLSISTRERLGVLLQEGGAYTAAPVADVLRLHWRLAAAAVPWAEAVDMFDCGPLLRRRLGRLSGGEQRRVCLTLAILSRPGLLLLDEPTTGMDLPTRERTWQVLESLRADGVAIVLSTHDLAEVSEHADDVTIIDGGRVRHVSTLASLLTRGRTLFIPLTHEDEPPAGRSGALADGRVDHATLTALARRLTPGVRVQRRRGGVEVSGPLTDTDLDTARAWADEAGLDPATVAVGRADLATVVRDLTEPPPAPPAGKQSVDQDDRTVR